MTPNEMANQLVAAGRSLITVLDEESAALTAARMSTVPEILEQKETAAASYETVLQALGKQPDALRAASPAARQAVVAMKDALDTASARNVNALRAALEMNRRLVQTIANSVNRQKVAASGYTKTGAAYGATPSSAGGEAVPVSFNETL